LDHPELMERMHGGDPDDDEGGHRDRAEPDQRARDPAYGSSNDCGMRSQLTTATARQATVTMEVVRADRVVSSYREVIAPPIGAPVPTLPKGAQSLTTGGITYYFEAKTYYRPLYSGSSVVYQVVAQPF
jgi:hypothetical protein